MTSSVGLAFAVLGAGGYGVGSVLQSIGAKRSVGIARTFAHPAYMAGLGADLVAWLASLVALRSLPVYVVQSVLAGSMAVTVLLARVMLNARLRRIDLAAIAVTVGALTVLAASAGPQPEIHLSSAQRWSLAASLLPVALAGWLCGRRRSAGGAAVVAGLAFGAMALCARGISVPSGLGRDLPGALATLGTDPLAYSLAGFGAAGMVLYAVALEHGDVGRVTAVLWVVEVLVPSAVGGLLFGDTVRAGWLPAAGVALLTAVGAAAVLAAAPAQVATVHPSVVPAPAGGPLDPPAS